MAATEIAGVGRGGLGEALVTAKAVNILIVDDDLQLLVEMRQQLEDSFAEVLIAQTPLAALWMLERESVHAVLCDLVLGSTDGGHLLEEVESRWPRTTRILMTGFGDRVVDESFPSAQRVMLKPCDAVTLAALVSELRAKSLLGD
jgi:DNA-binding NtrC family response regulator